MQDYMECICFKFRWRILVYLFRMAQHPSLDTASDGLCHLNIDVPPGIGVQEESQ